MATFINDKKAPDLLILKISKEEAATLAKDLVDQLSEVGPQGVFGVTISSPLSNQTMKFLLVLEPKT